jgi:hypothetical protein
VETIEVDDSAREILELSYVLNAVTGRIFEITFRMSSHADGGLLIGKPSVELAFTMYGVEHRGLFRLVAFTLEPGVTTYRYRICDAHD